MKTKLLLPALILFTACNTFASFPFNLDNFYIKAAIGPSFSDASNSSESGAVTKSYKNKLSTSGSIAVGTFFHPNVRGEIDLSLLRYDTNMTLSQDGGNFYQKNNNMSYNLLFKILPDLYDFGFGKLYLSAGVGVSRIDSKIRYSNDATSNNKKIKSKYHPALAIGAGAGFFLTNDIMLDLSYNYITSGKTESTSIMLGANTYKTNSMDNKSHNVNLGIRIRL